MPAGVGGGQLGGVGARTGNPSPSLSHDHMPLGSTKQLSFFWCGFNPTSPMVWLFDMLLEHKANPFRSML